MDQHFYATQEDSLPDSRYLDNSDHLLISSSRRTINMQDDLESAFDFKKEIERRYKGSFANKIYSFPRKVEVPDYDQSLSSESSYASLANISDYDLEKQNLKRVA